MFPDYANLTITAAKSHHIGTASKMVRRRYGSIFEDTWSTGPSKSTSILFLPSISASWNPFSVNVS